MLSDKARDAIREQMARYPVSRSALGSALYIAQEECGGWIPPEAVKDVAEVMGMEAADVQSMMSFYVMYHKAPIGKYLVEVCQNVSCALLGAHQVVDALEKKCGIHIGETSTDGLFTLKAVECSARCDLAPAVQVNGIFIEKMKISPDEALQLIDELKSKHERGVVEENLYNAVFTPEKAHPSAQKAAHAASGAASGAAGTG